MKKILIIGAVGQIGSELTLAMRERYGGENVIASTRKTPPSEKILKSGPFEYFDIRDRKALVAVCEKYRITHAINMAAVLSATGEKDPMLAWDINMNGLINLLEVAREKGLQQVLVPSSIAVFGPETPKVNTPQETVLRPTTMYGITKVAGELLGDYYVRKYGLDVRGLRYPGIISYETLPGGGTTDYAVAIFYDAIKYKKYTCFVREDTRLPMMYMPDCLKATIDLFEADFKKLKHHCDFNVAGMSFTAGELAAEIKKHIPDFTILGRTFFVANDDAVSWRFFAERIRYALGKERVLQITIPEGVALPIGYLTDLVGRLTGKALPINKQKVIEMKQAAWLCSNHAFRVAFGWRPRWTLDNALTETVSWYRHQGWLRS